MLSRQSFVLFVEPDNVLMIYVTIEIVRIPCQGIIDMR